MRMARASARLSSGSQARSWPHRLGPVVYSSAVQLSGSTRRPPQPYSTINPEGDPDSGRPGAKAGDAGAGAEGLGRDLGSVKRFERVADRIAKHDEVAHAPLIRQRAAAARDRHAGFLQAAGQRIERGAVRDFPAI